MGVVTKTTDEEGTARRFWLKFKKESVFAMYTPFVVCLASGNLEMETFRNYIAQDVHFLKAFAQAYELAAECADDDDAKAAIFQLRNNVLQELKMHDSFVLEWGLDPTKETTCNAATLRYTEFLLATASGKVEGEKGLGKIATPFEKTKIAAYTLGAMTPCMRLYAFLGKEIRALVSPDESSHPYKKWIDNYSSEHFEASALQIEELLDKLSISLTGEELEVIEKLYHQAMKLEIEFFSAQPIVQQILVPLSKMIDPMEERLMLFSDFDLTCTVVDSSAILAEIAIVTAPRADLDEQGNVLARMSSVDLKNTWGSLSTQYTEEYEQCIENILPREKVEKFNYEGLCKALEQLSEFEKRANLRVIDSGVLKGINLEDIKRAGEHIILQDGCINFFQKIFKNEQLNAAVHVLSYCWCADLMRSAFSSGGLNALNIHANEFAYEDAISTGEILRTVESPVDKVQAFKDILNKNESENSKLNVTVYIGDSVGDLLCLLEADIGIVVGSSESLRRVGSQFGVSFVPLFPGVVKKQKEFVESGLITGWEGQSGILYTVSSWAEIHALILGHQ
ncbi:Thiaminase-2/PQQ biosynthesis protein C [Macleaya cordata]|uniref:Thiaminase-2/PQQ biosynthesis protein C n=1 Tax=Macleaya cordata TaxID=56857 RepID=A0A200PVT4_MACCD|nr:Thiaminase-2/PQQ biosynthesis protein C [Macleaya cordata]